MSLASETQTRCQHRSLEHGGARNCAHCPWGLPLCALPPQCRVCFSSVPRHELVPTPSTTKMSTQAAASVQQPAWKKATPAEPGPTPKRPGAALSGADPASAVGGEAQATKAAVILPKPRVAPVLQPAVKHEEAVSAHTKKNSKARGSSACAEANSEEGQPDTSSAQERLRGQPLQGGPRPRTHCRGAGAEWRCILLWLR